VFCRRNPRRRFGVYASPHTPLPRACLSCSGALPGRAGAHPRAARRAAGQHPAPRLGGQAAACCGGRGALRCRSGDRVPPLARAAAHAAAAAGARLQRGAPQWRAAPLAARPRAGRPRQGLSFDAKDALWKQPGLKNILALHGSTLLQLSGVPLQLVASVSRYKRPNLDLSGLCLSKLGISCCGINKLLRLEFNEGAERLWLWPARLPGALEDLELLGLQHDWLGALAWAPGVGSGSAGRLPRLQTLRVTAGKYDRLETDNIPLLRGFPVLPALEVDSSGAVVRVRGNLFEQVGSVRIVSDGCIHLWDLWADQEDAATFVDRLCSAGLQAAELCAEHIGVMRSADDIAHEVVRELISRYSERFAVEVDVAEVRMQGEMDCRVIPVLQRLAWRRWPAPGAPGLPAARAAHARARAWAAEAEPVWGRCDG